MTWKVYVGVELVAERTTEQSADSPCRKLWEIGEDARVEVCSNGQ